MEVMVEFQWIMKPCNLELKIMLLKREFIMKVPGVNSLSRILKQKKPSK